MFEFVRSLLRDPQREAVERLLDRVERMSEDAVNAEFERILAASTELEVRAAESAPRHPLPRRADEFFRRFASITAPDYELKLGGTKQVDGLTVVVVGQTMGFDLLLVEGEDRLYVDEEDLNVQRTRRDGFPSLFHYVVINELAATKG